MAEYAYLAEKLNVLEGEPPSYATIPGEGNEKTGWTIDNGKATRFSRHHHSAREDRRC